MGGLLEPCNILARNRSAHGVNNSKWFGKCAFRLKKSVVVRKLLHHKVWKVPKNVCWGGGGVTLMWCAPNPATKCMQLLGEHHCITFQLYVQRKDESFNGCRFCAPAKCPPTVSQKFHSGGGGHVEVVRPQSCNKMHATAWRASLHHISTLCPKKRWKLHVFTLSHARAKGRCIPRCTHARVHVAASLPHRCGGVWDL